MIICKRDRFIFVHVPKCAGTSVRRQIEMLPGEKIVLAEPGDHPVLGRIDYGHIPLWKLRKHFPNMIAISTSMTASRWCATRYPASARRCARRSGPSTSGR